MIFTRTDAGLSNMCLFHCVDLIVFTEGGGDTVTEEQILEGSYHNNAVDIKFWNHVLKQNGCSKSFILKAIGSKTAVSSIADKILEGTVANIAVAMDRDHDDHFAAIKKSPLVLYTRGYSWECDVFDRALTTSQIENLLMIPEIGNEITSKIDYAYDSLEHQAFRLAVSEIISRSQGVSWCSDLSADEITDLGFGRALCRTKILSKLREQHRKLSKPANLPATKVFPLHTYFSTCGTLLKTFSLGLIRYICKKHDGPKSLSNDVLVASMLERFSISAERVQSAYYADLVQSLNNT